MGRNADNEAELEREAVAERHRAIMLCRRYEIDGADLIEAARRQLMGR